MQDLYSLGQEYADVVFVFSNQNTTESSDKTDDNGTAKCHAHRAVLQACVPDLAKLCKPYYKKSTPIPGHFRDSFEVCLRRQDLNPGVERAVA